MVSRRKGGCPSGYKRKGKGRRRGGEMDEAARLAQAAAIRARPRMGLMPNRARIGSISAPGPVAAEPTSWWGKAHKWIKDKKIISTVLGVTPWKGAAVAARALGYGRRKGRRMGGGGYVKF